MNNLIKAAIGVASTGTICTGGYFLWQEYVSNAENAQKPTLDEQEKKWSSLNTSSSNYEEGTMGKTYGNRLLDPFDEENKPKWEELYKKMAEDESKGENKEIKSYSLSAPLVSKAFSKEDESSNSSLNKTCKNYYSKQIEGKNESDTTKIKIGDDEWNAFWILCSMWNPKMLNKTKDDLPENSIVKDHLDELLSAEGTDNEVLWKEKNEEFFKLSSAPSEGLFKQLYEGNKDTDNQNKLKEKCGKIYKIVTGSEGSDVKAEDVIKYCSMKLIA